ncbi:chorismate mutase [Candidatus Woesearchaeota archaeon]|jgi:chorismate mutase|nr:chorismate mutase [Candidatus Woesearchaeota archaeon]MBT3438365.1 chorismate mutase [Candidatus Woesearchaeota archaeon]MBT4058380.1 chorismate mutase [Candidatus Woesearchaeota archaeon]MBT4207626.1 chorismate mutase [Candidatus Woesearchaeota archaeon]MBT4783091.1 chorismate mutase [Candidatus Woesearchaeota archaeon]
MDEINKLREKLDKIDLKLLKTLFKRNKITSKIKKIKKENELKLEDKTREKTILNRLNSKKLISKKTLENIYKEIFKQSK